MSFEVTVTPTVYDVEVAVNQSVQPFDVEVTVGNVPDLELTTNGDSGASTFDPLTGELNIPEYTLDGLGGVPESRTLTINGTTQDLSANRTFTIPAPDPVTIGSPANGLAIDGNQVLTIGLASSGANGALSSTDWTTFNNKQNALGYTAEDVANKSTDTGLGTSNTLYPSQGAVKSYIDTGLSGKENTLGFTPENVANKAINLTSPDDTKYPTTLAVSTALAGKQDVLTNPITGTGVAGQVSFWNDTSTQSGDSLFVWNDTDKLVSIGNTSTQSSTRLYIEENFTAQQSNGVRVRGKGSSTGVWKGRIVAGGDNFAFLMGEFNSQAWLGAHNAALNAWAPLYINPSGSEDLYIGSGVLTVKNSSRNVLINQGTDVGFRLDVNGTARVQGALSVITGADVTPLTISGYSLTGSNTQPALSITGTWNTTGTPTALLVNVTDTASDASSLFADFQVGGATRVSLFKSGRVRANAGFFIGSSNSNDIYATDGSTNKVDNGLYTGLRFGGTNTSGYGLTISGFNDIGRSNTSGVAGILSLFHGFKPTSGTGTFIGLQYQGTINQTGGANGITRGIYVNPTLTSAFDWRSIEWNNNTGWGLYGVGTANNYLNGKLLVKTNVDAGFDLDVNGTARVQGAITTGAPTGGTAKPFKIGAVATVTPTSPNRTIEIEIDGTTYYLTAKTTND